MSAETRAQRRNARRIARAQRRNAHRAPVPQAPPPPVVGELPRRRGLVRRTKAAIMRREIARSGIVPVAAAVGVAVVFAAVVVGVIIGAALAARAEAVQ